MDRDSVTQFLSHDNLSYPHPALIVVPHAAFLSHDHNSLDDVTDRMLLRRMTSGDRDALATLYRSYHGRLCRFLSRVTRRPDVIEETINDCFWIVWQKASDFRGDSRVST